MTDTPGSNPFSGFTGFTPSDMLDRMWDMMRLSPFGAGIGAAAPSGLPPSLSAMSDMMSPLSSVEELDKRITDLRAVEQWLKLNLGMLQSAIQALEVQRATLATLRAFGALAKESMSAAEAAMAKDTAPPQAFGGAAPAGAGKPDAETPPGAMPGGEAFDPAGWWNLLQSQFNQLASFAMTQPGAAGAAPAAAKPAGGGARGPEPAASGAAPRERKPATRRAAPPKPRAAAPETPDDAHDAAPPAAKSSRKRSP
ncbi:PhaM family polyhydroxyalkanoate granule multifunctional regulatory protein [Burkholderia gladioli]|uniref:PhaM family polyhydroxyalkanoate granule multifunctional regulatory protein n=1 Tax=Burkholderia gladioli TaxID=28095 RepID=UPI00163E1F5A|nr:PhaM family polyhydroxyalkanoate granule multifunctional regulatory protein [Burkholderia gladioli]